jgi:hypothetical protein
MGPERDNARGQHGILHGAGAAQGMGSIPTVHLERKLGQVSAETLDRVKGVIAFAMDFATSRSNES